VRLGTAGRLAAKELDFDDLYRRYFRRVKGVAQARVHDPQIAEDVAQETFIRVWRGLDRFDPQRPIWPWLFTVADRTAIGALRRNGSSRSASLDKLDESLTYSIPGPEERVLSHELAVETLPQNPRQKNVLMMRLVYRMSYVEIAEAVNTSTEAISSLLQRARKTVREKRKSASALLWPRVVSVARRFSKATGRAEMVAADLVAEGVAYLAAGIYLLERSSVGAAVALSVMVAGATSPAAIKLAVNASPPRISLEARPIAGSLDKDSSPTVKQFSTEVSSGDLNPSAPSISGGASIQRSRGSVDGKVWDKLPDHVKLLNDGETGNGFTINCDSGQRVQDVCDALDTLP
jgi:RNA polymerase sigma-70 factor, ECF subfamily